MKKNQNMQRASLMHITVQIQQSSRRDLDLGISVHFLLLSTTTVIFPDRSRNEIFLEFYLFRTTVSELGNVI